MARPIWFLLPLAAAALVAGFLALRQGEVGVAKERAALEELARRDRMPPQPAPAPGAPPKTLWFAAREPDWSSPENGAELLAEMLALDALLVRGTWSREAQDLERTGALAPSAVLARLTALEQLAARSVDPHAALPLVVPLLLRERLDEPAIFAPLWRLYRAPIRAELLRARPTHAARLLELLARAPSAPAEELVLEIWAADESGFLRRAGSVELVRAIGGAPSLARLVPALAALEAPEPLLDWAEVAARLAREGSSREGALPALLAAAERSIEAALAKRRPDELLRRALRLEAELLGRRPEERLAERLSAAPAGSPIRARWERLAAGGSR